MQSTMWSMSRTLTSLCAVFVITGSVSPLLATVPDGAVSLTRDARDPRWLRGEVLVDASPAKVLARVDQWSELFSDVRTVRVVKRSADHWHVRLDTRTMDCGEHDYHITFSSGERMDLRIDAPGINAHGSLSAHATGEAAQSRVKFELFIDTKGFMGWFIPERTLRKRQERMVRGDLEDLARSFVMPPASGPDFRRSRFGLPPPPTYSPSLRSRYDELGALERLLRLANQGALTRRSRRDRRHPSDHHRAWSRARVRKGSPKTSLDRSGFHRQLRGDQDLEPVSHAMHLKTVAANRWVDAAV